MIKVAVIGVGYLGMHHARIYSELPGCELTAVVDVDPDRAGKIAAQFGCRAETDFRRLIGEVDAASIVVPTAQHFPVGLEFLRSGTDLLIEKPITSTVSEAAALIREAQKSGAVLQVGHVERFNPGVREVFGCFKAPSFIEAQRRAPFGVRGTDVDVTLDLMIHDIDIILALVKSKVKNVRAAGAGVVSDHLDVASAWIEFENGCIALATASRVSSERLRRFRIFERDRVISLNFQNQQVSVKTKLDKDIHVREIIPGTLEPLKAELESFLECVATRRQPMVTGDDGLEALKVALRISKLVNGRADAYDTNG
jgi:predicted dehydrogenase